MLGKLAILNTTWHRDEQLFRAFPANTLIRSSGSTSSRSASELLLTQ